MAELTSSSAPVSVRPRRVSMSMTALRFGVVGAGGVVVNMLVLHVLYGMVHLPLLVASPVAVALAVVHNYLLNNRWTFGLRRASLTRFARFGLSALTTMLLNVGVVWALVGLGAHHLVANVAGIAVAAGLNFGASTMWVWRERRTSTWGAGLLDGAGQLVGEPARSAGAEE